MIQCWLKRTLNTKSKKEICPIWSIITFKWDNAEPITYYDAFAPAASDWKHTSTASYTSFKDETIADWKDPYERLALLITDQYGGLTMLPGISRTTTSSAATQAMYNFQLPSNDVFSEIRATITNAHRASLRFYIDSVYQSGYPVNSNLASKVFDPSTYQLLEGASISLVKWRY